jgi:hypothetical protein
MALPRDRSLERESTARDREQQVETSLKLRGTTGEIAATGALKALAHIVRRHGPCSSLGGALRGLGPKRTPSVGRCRILLRREHPATCEMDGPGGVHCTVTVAVGECASAPDVLLIVNVVVTGMGWVRFPPHGSPRRTARGMTTARGRPVGEAGP